MKRFAIFTLLACLSFTSCVRDIISTDTWTCSVRVSTKENPSTDGVCIVKAGYYDEDSREEVQGDNLYVYIYSNHSNLTVVSCDLDIVPAQTKESVLGAGRTISLANGMTCISFGYRDMARSIAETTHHNFRLRVKDELSGQEKEFTKTIYTYKYFFLSVVFRRPNVTESDKKDSWIDIDPDVETPEVWGGQELRYRIYSNQRSIVVKSVVWEQNDKADSRIEAGRRITLGSKDEKTGLYFKEYTIVKENNDIPELFPDGKTRGDETGKTFELVAFAEDGNPDEEAVAQTKYNRYYTTVLQAQLGVNSGWDDEYTRGRLEQNRSVYLKFRYNRSDKSESNVYVKSVYAAPDVMNAYEPCWFPELMTTNFQISSFDNTRIASFAIKDGSLTQELIPSNFKNNPHWEGSLTIKLSSKKPDWDWELTIPYDVYEKSPLGPESILIQNNEGYLYDAKGNVIKSNSDTTDVHFNQGQFYAMKVNVSGNGQGGDADGDLCVRLENADAQGAVDFCFVKRDAKTGKWIPFYHGAWDESGQTSIFNIDDQTNNPDKYFCGFQKASSSSDNTVLSIPLKNVKEAGSSVYLFCRGLDRGGKATVRLFASVEGKNGVRATAMAYPFVRHRAAVLLKLRNCDVTTYSFKCSRWPDSDQKYGWYNVPEAISFSVCLLRNSGSIPTSGERFSGFASSLEALPVSANAVVSLRLEIEGGSIRCIGKCNEIIGRIFRNEYKGSYGCCHSDCHTEGPSDGDALMSYSELYVHTSQVLENNDFHVPSAPQSEDINVKSSGYYDAYQVYHSSFFGYELYYYCDLCQYGVLYNAFVRKPAWNPSSIYANLFCTACTCDNKDVEIRWFVRGYNCTDGAKYWNDGNSDGSQVLQNISDIYQIVP